MSEHEIQADPKWLAAFVGRDVNEQDVNDLPDVFVWWRRDELEPTEVVLMTLEEGRRRGWLAGDLTIRLSD